MWLPLNNGTDYPVMQDDVDEWLSLYPAVDVIQELRSMRGWCLSNPSKKKTKRGIKAFINRWLSKRQDQAPRQTQGGNYYGKPAANTGTTFIDLLNAMEEQEKGEIVFDT
jgi:hypothetical protein